MNCLKWWFGLVLFCNGCALQHWPQGQGDDAPGYSTDDDVLQPYDPPDETPQMPAHPPGDAGVRAVVDSGMPAIAADAGKPVTVVDAGKPAVTVDAGKPDAAADSGKPVAPMVDAGKPVAVVDAGKPADTTGISQRQTLKVCVLECPSSAKYAPAYCPAGDYPRCYVGSCTLQEIGDCTLISYESAVPIVPGDAESWLKQYDNLPNDQLVSAGFWSFFPPYAGHPLAAAEIIPEAAYTVTPAQVDDCETRNKTRSLRNFGFVSCLVKASARFALDGACAAEVGNDPMRYYNPSPEVGATTPFLMKEYCMAIKLSLMDANLACQWQYGRFDPAQGHGVSPQAQDAIATCYYNSTQKSPFSKFLLAQEERMKTLSEYRLSLITPSP